MTSLTETRYNLVKKFLAEAGLWSTRIETYLRDSTFEVQDDGGMGSFGIRNPQGREGARDYAEAEYVDADGKKVVIALIGDEEGYPTDVDFWKVDSSALIRFPDADSLHIIKK